jgi:hypothetical protein
VNPERFLALDRAEDKADAVAFLARASRLDESAVTRLSVRPDGLIGLWSHTGFEVLVTRAVFGRMAPRDLVCDASTLRQALAAAEPGAAVDPGMPFDSAWRGALPLQTGYRHVDDVPARAVVELARDGARVAREEGSAHGPATGLLDQPVLEVASADGNLTAAVSMRSLFALTAMGFVRDADGRAITESSDVEAVDPAEPIRIRMSAAWIRIDARYGAVYQRRHRDLDVTVR